MNFTIRKIIKFDLIKNILQSFVPGGNTRSGKDVLSCSPRSKDDNYNRQSQYPKLVGTYLSDLFNQNSIQINSFCHFICFIIVSRLIVSLFSGHVYCLVG